MYIILISIVYYKKTPKQNYRRRPVLLLKEPTTMTMVANVPRKKPTTKSMAKPLVESRFLIYNLAENIGSC